LVLHVLIYPQPRSWMSQAGRAVLHQTTTAQVGRYTMTCGDARGVHRRLCCIPHMSHAPAIWLRTCTISLGICPVTPVQGRWPGHPGAREWPWLPVAHRG